MRRTVGGAIMGATDKEETYSEEETVARREATLKTLLSTPHKAHKDSKKGNRTK